MFGWHRPVGHQQILEHLHLAAEILLGPLVGGAGRGHHLDGDRAAERQLPREVDLAHAAAADPALDQEVGVGGGELTAESLAGVAEPAGRAARPPAEPACRSTGAACSQPKQRIGSRPPSRVSLNLDGERAVAGRDHIAVAEMAPTPPRAR